LEQLRDPYDRRHIGLIGERASEAARPARLAVLTGRIGAQLPTFKWRGTATRHRATMGAVEP
jgi:hypothetical protein